MATRYSTFVRRSACLQSCSSLPRKRATRTPNLCSSATKRERTHDARDLTLTEANSCERLTDWLAAGVGTSNAEQLYFPSARTVTPTRAGVCGPARPHGPPLAAASSQRRGALIDVSVAALLVAVEASLKTSWVCLSPWPDCSPLPRLQLRAVVKDGAALRSRPIDRK